MGRIIKHNTDAKDPNGMITRGEAALELYRFAIQKHYVRPNGIGKTSESDDAWIWAVTSGLIHCEGKVVEEEDREKPLNRAEAAYMFHKFDQYCKMMDVVKKRS